MSVHGPKHLTVAGIEAQALQAMTYWLDLAGIADDPSLRATYFAEANRIRTRFQWRWQDLLISSAPSSDGASA